MAELNPVKFLTNTGESKDDAEVEAPAFSLTKVLTTGAIIIGPLATLLVDKVAKVDFSEGQLVALAIGLLGFLAIASAADVIGRSVATAAAKNAEAAGAAFAQTIVFKKPLKASRIVSTGTGIDVPVELLAVAQGDETRYLVKEGDEPLHWMSASSINVGG